MGNLKIGVLPISNEIAIGTVKKDGYWGSNRTNVTMDAISAVAQYIRNLDTDNNGIRIFDQNNEFMFALHLEEKQPEQELRGSYGLA